MGTVPQVGIPVGGRAIDFMEYSYKLTTCPVPACSMNRIDLHGSVFQELSPNNNQMVQENSSVFHNTLVQ